MAGQPAAPTTAHPHSNTNEAWHFFGYIFPYILLIGGYMVPSLQYRVHDVIPTEHHEMFFIAIIVEIVLIVIWIIIDFVTITSEKTTGSQLQWNAAISSTSNNIFVLLLGFMIGMGQLGWWLVVPVIGQIVDDYIISNRAIVNALQKPFGLGRVGN